MSTPTQPMPGTDVRAEIARFVVAVERALDDLPRDDAAELTDGLEADLTEAWAAEGSSPASRFGSPESYADELRAAAGLPPRARGGFHSLALDFGLSRGRDELLERLRSQSWWPQAVEYGHELRPAWWALRGVTLVGLAGFAVALFLGALPWVPLAIVVAPAAIWGAVISMRHGAADMNSVGRTGRVLTLANIVVVLALVWAALAFAGAQSSGDVIYSDSPPSGLASNGETVTNVFAYDTEGKPLTRFRLYDQAGRPLNVGGEAREGWDDQTGAHWAAEPDMGSGPLEWNVFPLHRTTDPVPDPGTGEATGKPIEGPVSPPYPELPALPASPYDAGGSRGPKG